MNSQSNPYRRLSAPPPTHSTAGSGGGVLPTHTYSHREAGGYYGPDVPFGAAGMESAGLFGARQINLGNVFQFFQTVLIAFIALAILIFIFEVSSHKSEVTALVSRMETMETLGRNVNDGLQVFRRVFGDPYPESVPQHSLWGKDVKEEGRSWSIMRRWTEPKGPDDEALITYTAADEIVRGVRSALALITQIEKSRIVESVSKAVQDADGVLTRPELKELMAFVMKLTMHDSQVQEFARKSIELAMHFESVLMPLMDTLSAEIKAWKHGGESGSGPKSIEQEIMESQQMREKLRQFGAMAKEVGEGIHDLMAWYRRGGPEDAVALGSDMIRTSKELIESPAATSLVRVLEGIDWRRTGDYVGDATRDITAILGDIHDSGAVMSSDRALRSISALLEDPATRKMLDAGPGIANNITGLLSRPNSQQLISRSGELIRRIESMLSQAEDAGTVEKSSEFLGIMRELLGGLVHGGLHLELGDESAQRARGDSQRIGRVMVGPEEINNSK